MKSIHLRLGLIYLLLGWVIACNRDPNGDIKNIELSLDFERVDSLMYECSRSLSTQSEIDILEAYKTHLEPEKTFFYEYLGLNRYRSSPGLEGNDSQLDTLLANELEPFLHDPNVFQLLDTIQSTFPSGFPFKEEILPPLKRIKKYFPDSQFPAFRTHVNNYASGGDYSTVDQFVSIPGYISFGLHYFLGAEWPYYPANIPKYMRKRFSPEYAPVLLVRNVAEEFVIPLSIKRQPHLLERMIHSGIKQYFIHQMLPNTADSLLFLYSKEQMEWAELFEQEIYEELSAKFYNTDVLVQRDYLSEKPYTTSLSLESAPRLGEYAGYKIVAAYMRRNPKITLAELCEMDDFQTIFRESRYKP